MWPLPLLLQREAELARARLRQAEADAAAAGVGVSPERGPSSSSWLLLKMLLVLCVTGGLLYAIFFLGSQVGPGGLAQAGGGMTASTEGLLAGCNLARCIALPPVSSTHIQPPPHLSTPSCLLPLPFLTDPAACPCPCPLLGPRAGRRLAVGCGAAACAHLHHPSVPCVPRGQGLPATPIPHRGCQVRLGMQDGCALGL